MKGSLTHIRELQDALFERDTEIMQLRRKLDDSDETLKEALYCKDRELAKEKACTIALLNLLRYVFDKIGDEILINKLFPDSCRVLLHSIRKALALAECDGVPAHVSAHLSRYSEGGIEGIKQRTAELLNIIGRAFTNMPSARLLDSLSCLFVKLGSNLNTISEFVENIKDLCESEEASNGVSQTGLINDIKSELADLYNLADNPGEAVSSDKICAAIDSLQVLLEDLESSSFTVPAWVVNNKTCMQTTLIEISDTLSELRKIKLHEVEDGKDNNS